MQMTSSTPSVSPRLYVFIETEEILRGKFINRVRVSSIDPNVNDPDKVDQNSFSAGSYGDDVMAITKKQIVVNVLCDGGATVIDC